MENKFKQVTLRIFKYLPFDKQYVSHATEEMIEYKDKDKDTNYDYVDFIEIAAVEQLKADLKIVRETLEGQRAINDRQYDLHVKEIQQLKSKLEKAKKGLEFYASLDNWETHILSKVSAHRNVIDKSDVDFFKAPKSHSRYESGGKTARQVLKEIEG